jgi:hypothetical protein
MFIRQMAAEVTKRLDDVNMLGRSITLKIMKRSAGAPAEGPKVCIMGMYSPNLLADVCLTSFLVMAVAICSTNKVRWLGLMDEQLTMRELSEIMPGGY